MSDDSVLLGTPIEEAMAVLRRDGFNPDIVYTTSPKGQRNGIFRVLKISDDGKKIVASAFLDPIADIEPDI